MDKPDQIALLIDADNATAARIDVILDELSRHGETNILRAYGNWTKTGLKSWQEVLHDNAIRPVQQFNPSKGKDASGIALAVDAVEILHTQRPDWFAIASSDADFTPLAMHLREHGAKVYGFGDAKTPQPFQSACTRFLVLNRIAPPAPVIEETAPDAVAPGSDAASPAADEAPPAAPRRRRATATATTKAAATKAAATKATAAKTSAAKASTAKAAEPTTSPATSAKATSKAAGDPASTTPPARFTRNQLRSDTKLVTLLRRTVEGAAEDDGWARVSIVGQRIARQSSFDAPNYGYAKLSKLLEATDLFEMRDVGGPGMAVRDSRTSTHGTAGGAN